jgi:tripartite motif-containing protein 2/3/tripartite motif-containing protein 71
MIYVRDRRLSIAVVIGMALLLLTAVNCGPKPWDKPSETDAIDISGFIFVAEIRGELGTKVMSRPGSLAIDALGNLLICDTGNHRVIKVKPDGTLLTETGGFGFSRGQFNYPTALATSDGVNFYLLDAENSRIVRLDYDLNWIAEDYIAEIQIDPALGRGNGIAVNSFGDIFLADPDNNRIVRFNQQLQVVSELVSLSGFLEPRSITCDPRDYLFIVDGDNDNIVVFDSYDNYNRTIGDDKLYDPFGICIDDSGLLYVVDRKVNSISVFDRADREIFMFGSTGMGQYQFRQATSICTNEDGWLFVSDSEGDRVVVYRPNKP